MTKKHHTPEEIRERVILFLLFLTSDKCLDLAAEIFPRDQLLPEICRVWFDEIYTPGITYLNRSLKGDLKPENVARFEEAFDAEALIELERFHHFFELRVEILRKSSPDLRHLTRSSMWEDIRRHAGYVLQALCIDILGRRLKLEQHFESEFRTQRSQKHWERLFATG